MKRTIWFSVPTCTERSKSLRRQCLSVRRAAHIIRGLHLYVVLGEPTVSRKESFCAQKAVPECYRRFSFASPTYARGFGRRSISHAPSVRWLQDLMNTPYDQPRKRAQRRSQIVRYSQTVQVQSDGSSVLFGHAAIQATGITAIAKIKFSDFIKRDANAGMRSQGYQL